ncbi:hypothetical protein SAMN02746066_03459 [Anaerosporobacter mobilis DSM 15930]|uniref:Phage integrase family protein n=1 Tax=Anaerosporobacter mobilis DSM 15930 TaxID=1120996 RepID=A0A1M7LWD6_9FIRM|nr:site-specific integrase [Anaerosporobacter mobilis]SHM82561.1 hypothetical protein SAMN02746066_03459 [Anaerosporobacter mobilis DSM 15930]
MIRELKDRFLNENPGYINDINNFINYIETQIEQASFYNEFTLRGMTVKGILNSLEYLVNIEQIQKKEPAKKYISAVGQLFAYIFDNSEIQNISLKSQLDLPQKRKGSYLKVCYDFISKSEVLQDKESYKALDDATVNKLIIWCDNKIDKAIDQNSNNIKDINFKHMVAALCIKLILLTGCTYRVVRAIKISDLDTELSLITVNGYDIRLPLGLSRQFKYYKQIYIDKKFNYLEGFLFVGTDGKQWGSGTSSSGITNYLKTEIEKTDITGIIKYGITQLMLQDVNDSVIIRLTGANKDIIEDCLPQDSKKEIEWFSYINSKIVKTGIYKEL